MSVKRDFWDRCFFGIVDFLVMYSTSLRSLGVKSNFSHSEITPNLRYCGSYTNYAGSCQWNVKTESGRLFQLLRLDTACFVFNDRNTSKLETLHCTVYFFKKIFHIDMINLPGKGLSNASPLRYNNVGFYPL